MAAWRASVRLQLILLRDAIHSAAYAVVRRLSACLSVRPSVTFVSCIETSEHILKLFHRLVDPSF